MTEELKLFFQRLLPTVDGLEGIVVADRDGVPVLEVSTGLCPPNVLKPLFLGAFSLCSDQAGKVGFGKNKRITTFYSDHQVIQFNYFPVIVTLIAKSSANTGLLYMLDEEMKDAVSDLTAALNFQ
ncbi:ragulator complex protein LAMTOR3-A-like [Dysidea avara]|uniref:ragulator complex protein LAMTOR3-A-like n=1 Tax=Dysidea avara TaxID=196820 RepID=UPI003334633A